MSADDGPYVNGMRDPGLNGMRDAGNGPRYRERKPVP